MVTKTAGEVIKTKGEYLMSSKKKTAAQWEEMAKRAEERAKELKQKAKEATKAEKAKINSKIIKALEEWQNCLPEENKTPWEELPELFKQAGIDGKYIGGGYDWYDDYHTLKDLVDRLCAVIGKDPSEFEQYVEWREQKSQEQKS